MQSALLVRNTLGITLDNLFGRRSDTFAYGNPFRAATPQVTPQRPFSASFVISRQF